MDAVRNLPTRQLRHRQAPRRLLQKGTIAPGSNADLVLIDPHLRKTITLADLHADSDYSIWEGFACQGYPVMTILRGKVIVEDGRLLGSSADGQWLRRKISSDVLSRPVV